jgi:hypothetical protein
MLSELDWSATPRKLWPKANAQLVETSQNDAERVIRRHLRVELRLEHFELFVQEFGKTLGRVLLKQQTMMLLEFVTEPK